MTLIETLLGIVRGADEWEQMDLNTVVETTLSLIETQLRHDEIEVIRELSDVPPMHARKSFIQDMLLNLILNARKAMSEGGELRIAVCSSSADSVRMEVSDSGVGIEAEKLPHIFDPFFTQQKGSGGTGLGLYMVQHIVEEHGGQIEVRSEIGRGTTFEIELPTRSERAAGEGSVTAVDDSAETQQFALMRQLQVLVGEMDGDTIAQFRQAVDGGSWDLAGDSATMLEMARSSRYDVMFLSTQLPGEPGVRELYEEMVQLSQGPVYLVHEGQELPDGLPSSDTLLRRPLQVEDLCILLEGLAKTGEST